MSANRTSATISLHRLVAVSVLFAMNFMTGLVDAQPVHHFSFDEDAGLATSDRSCGQGTLLGFDFDDDTQWVGGQVNGALDLGVDGILDNRVAIDLSDTAGGEPGFTVALWINPGEQILTLGEYQILATPGDVVGFTLMNIDAELRHDRVLLFWDGNLQNLHVGTTTLEPDTWYHVAITSTGVGGEKLYYINGELEEQTLFLPSQGGTDGFHPGNVDGWAAGVGLVGAIGAGARAHDSIVDELQIFDRALTAEEMSALVAESPSRQPVIENISPADGNPSHTASEGLAFDVRTTEPGATIAEGDIHLFLNDVDVSASLDIVGSENAREVLYDGLEEKNAYSARIEVIDSEGSGSCALFSFGTLDEQVGGLLHHFRMDETSGLVALDLASARNGSLMGFENDDNSQWAGSVCDNGLDLGIDATLNNYVEFTSNAVSAFDSGGFTVSMWLRPGEQILTPGEYQLLSSPGDSVGFTIMNFNGEVRHDRVLLFWDGNLPDLHVGVTTLEPGNWYHVAITSTGAGGEKFYYVNGELEEQVLFLPSRGGVEGFHPGTADGWAEGIAQIGAINGGRNHDSIVDDVRIYNRALEEDEILEVLEECDPLICEPLELRDLSPQNGDNFHDATLGLEFEVATSNKGFSIDAGDVVLTLNDVDVSGDLILGGTGAERVVTYAGLEAGTTYAAMISVSDGCGSLQRTLSFSTFVQCASDEKSLVHYWKLDEISGQTAFDCVGGSLGTFAGFPEDDSQWTDGIVDGGLDFGSDEVRDNIMSAPVAALDALDTGGLTIAMWVRPGEQILTTGEYQLYNAPGGGVGFTIMNFDGEVRHDRVLLFWDGSLPDLHVGVTTLEPDTWYHVAITSTGVGGDKLYYINGELEEQTLFRPSQGGTEGFHPGTSNGWGAGVATFGAIGLARYHDSAYDEIRIYNTALEEDEIAELASALPPSVTFSRGDADGSGALNITDGIFVLNFLFLGGGDPPCMDAADADDSNSLNITDGIYILNFLFLGGPNPAPPENCGVDPSDDTLDCIESTDGCGV